jgi:hypothetical protein
LLHLSGAPKENVALFSAKRWNGAGLGLGLALVLAFPLPAAPRGQAIEEYQLKAAFILNIAKFVEWPTDAFQGPRDPIVLCILGASPFGDALAQAADGKTIDDRKFAIRPVSDMKQVGGCHILFVSSSERKRFRSVLGEIASRGILTVGDVEGFTSEGGVVHLRLDGEKIRIGINMHAAELERIRISSKLLSLAQIVNK